MCVQEREKKNRKRGRGRQRQTIKVMEKVRDKEEAVALSTQETHFPSNCCVNVCVRMVIPLCLYVCICETEFVFSY